MGIFPQIMINDQEVTNLHKIINRENYGVNVWNSLFVDVILSFFSEMWLISRHVLIAHFFLKRNVNLVFHLFSLFLSLPWRLNDFYEMSFISSRIVAPILAIKTSKQHALNKEEIVFQKKKYQFLLCHIYLTFYFYFQFQFLLLKA